MSVVFFGTSDYCLPVVESIFQNYRLVLIVTRPDRPAGRKRVLTPSPVKVWAEARKIPLATPATLKKDTSDRADLIRQLTEVKPDLAVVADYGLIIPEGIFNLPRLGTLNIHFSRLPKLRGPSPVQFTLLAGAREAWITVFKLENPPLPVKMDSGPIVWQKSFPIVPDDTTQSLYTKLFREAAGNLSQIIASYSAAPEALSPQDHGQATFTRFLTRDDGYVPFEKLENPENYNKFRAYYPWPGLWSRDPKTRKRLKVLKCHVADNKLVLDRVQIEGEKVKNL